MSTCPDHGLLTLSWTLRAPQWCDSSASACKQTARKSVHGSTLVRARGSTQLQSSAATLSMKSLCSDAAFPLPLSPLLPAPSMFLLAPLPPPTPPLPCSYSFCFCSRLRLLHAPPPHLIPQRIRSNCPRNQTFTTLLFLGCILER